MRISVIVPIARLGGIDVLYDGLQRQTFKGEWELILVDEWKNEREDVVWKMAQTHKIPIPVAHIKPDRRGLAHALNLGVLRAKGELICPLNDYHWPPPNWLERHWRVYEQSGGKWTCNGFAYHHEPPELTSFPRPRYLKNHILYSIFEEPFCMEMLEKLPIIYEETLAWMESFRWPLGSKRWIGDAYPQNEKLSLLEHQGLYTSTGREYYNTLNNSIPRELLLRLNGYDETYDQSRAVLDIDMGLRAELLGHRFILDIQSIVHVMAHESIDKRFGHLWKKFFTWKKPHEVSLDHMALKLKLMEESIRSPKGLEEAE